MVKRQNGALVSAKTALALSQRQSLGFLPSNRFWRELWKTEPQLQMYFVALQTMIVAPFAYLCIVYIQPSWLSALLVVLGTFLGGGVAERLLRLWVVRSARLTAARSHDDEATK